MKQIGQRTKRILLATYLLIAGLLTAFASGSPIGGWGMPIGGLRGEPVGIEGDGLRGEPIGDLRGEPIGDLRG